MTYFQQHLKPYDGHGTTKFYRCSNWTQHVHSCMWSVCKEFPSPIWRTWYAVNRKLLKPGISSGEMNTGREAIVCVDAEARKLLDSALHFKYGLCKDQVPQWYFHCSMVYNETFEHQKTLKHAEKVQILCIISHATLQDQYVRDRIGFRSFLAQ